MNVKILNKPGTSEDVVDDRCSPPVHHEVFERFTYVRAGEPAWNSDGMVFPPTVRQTCPVWRDWCAKIRLALNVQLGQGISDVVLRW